MGKEFAKLLNEEYVKALVRRKHKYFQNQWALDLGVNNASLSRWMTGVSEPDAKSTHQLARKLGPQVYKALNLPVIIPDDPTIEKVVEGFLGSSTEVQDEIMRIIDAETLRIQKEVKRALDSV